jgi:rhamnosyltransferase
MMPAPKYLGDFYNAIIQNKLAGHTQVFNAALRNLLLEVPADKMYMYDWMAYILASAFGKVIFETRCLGKYRQHGNNAVGYELSPLAQIPRRLKRLKTGAFKLIALQISYFYEIFGARLDEASKKELKRLLGGLSSFPKRLNYALTTKVKRNTRFESLQFRALYVLGAYGKTEINDTNSTNMKRGGN